MKHPLTEARPILAQIEEHDYEAYLVGGCVRDTLLKRPIGDIDITTSAPPKVIQEIFTKTIPVGIEHGTVIVRYNHASYEVTTFRLDGEYSDNRHPDQVQFVQSLDEDLKRRDFTINALAMDQAGDITDLFGGVEDIEHQLIKTVGDGEQRFKEDALRMIRALRFSSQLGFTIEDQTLQDITENKHLLNTVATERITVEMQKFFAGEHLHNGLNYLKKTGVDHYLPVFHLFPSLINGLKETVQPLQKFSEVITLFHWYEPTISIETWVKEWKCSNKTKQEAQQFTQALQTFQDHGLNNWLIYQLDSSLFAGFVRLCHYFMPNHDITCEKLTTMQKNLVIKQKGELQINGHDLIALFPDRKKGAWIRDSLQLLEKSVVMGTLENKQTILKEWIKWNPPATN